jgi:hypothetical protein
MEDIKPLLGRAWDQTVYLACGKDDLLPAKLAVGFDYRATISDGWGEFAQRLSLSRGPECIFEFVKSGCYITVRTLH